MGAAVSFSAHDSLLGASGDLQTSSEYDDLEKERPEEVDMGVMKGTVSLQTPSPITGPHTPTILMEKFEKTHFLQTQYS